MERRDVADRQFDALLERLDRIAQQLEKIDRRLETQEGLVLISKELRSLEESLKRSLAPRSRRCAARCLAFWH